MKSYIYRPVIQVIFRQMIILFFLLTLTIYLLLFQTRYKKNKKNQKRWYEMRCWNGWIHFDKLYSRVNKSLSTQSYVLFSSKRQIDNDLNWSYRWKIDFEKTLPEALWKCPTDPVNWEVWTMACSAASFLIRQFSGRKSARISRAATTRKEWQLPASQNSFTQPMRSPQWTLSPNAEHREMLCWLRWRHAHYSGFVWASKSSRQLI